MRRHHYAVTLGILTSFQNGIWNPPKVMQRHSLISVPTALGNAASVLILDLNVTVEMPILFRNTPIDGWAVESDSEMFLCSPWEFLLASHGLLIVSSLFCAWTPFSFWKALCLNQDFIQCLTQTDWCLFGRFRPVGNAQNWTWPWGGSPPAQTLFCWQGMPRQNATVKLLPLCCKWELRGW